MKKRSQVLWFIMLVCVFGINLCYAEPTEEPGEITVPAQYGSIIETHKGTNAKLIVHIQDAHANYEAQKNIAAIVEDLIKNYNVNLVLREGASTDKNFAYLRERASLKARRNAAEKLLKDATITGIDYLTLTSNYPISFQGIEDKQLYDANKNALWEMDKFKDIALEYVNKLTIAADSLKTKIYNADLLAMDKAKKDYENETMGLSAYYKILNDIIKKKNIAIEEFPNFSAFVKGEIKDLNINNLFKEELLMANKIHEAISENDDQKALYRVSLALSIMDKMLSVKLVPEEYSYFLDNKKDFDPQAWADFLKKKSDELGLGLSISDNYYAISDNMPTIEKFYSTAGERDIVFITKSEERMQGDNAQVAILIAGGFHTPTLTNMLADKGYSYIVISPRVTTKTDDNLYRQALKND